MTEHKLLPAPIGTRAVYYQIDEPANDPDDDTLKVVFYPVMYFRVTDKGRLAHICAGPHIGWEEIRESFLGYDSPGLEFDWNLYARHQYRAPIDLQNLKQRVDDALEK